MKNKIIVEHLPQEVYLYLKDTNNRFHKTKVAVTGLRVKDNIRRLLEFSYVDPFTNREITHVMHCKSYQYSKNIKEVVY